MRLESDCWSSHSAMFRARISDPITIILGGGLLYTFLTFPLVSASTIASEIHSSSFEKAFVYSVFCFVCLCLGLWFGSRVARGRETDVQDFDPPEAADLRPLIGRSICYWAIGVVFAVAIVIKILGGFGALSTAVVTSNDLVRGKAWLFTSILPLKVGVFGIFLCLITTQLRSNRMILMVAFVPMLAVALFFLNVIGGRLFACGLILQLLIACGQVMRKKGRLLLFTEIFAVLCLVTIIGVYGIGRYALGVSRVSETASTEVAQHILQDQNRLERMLLNNFFDPWFTLTAAVSYHEGGEPPMYGLYHVTAFAKLVPGLYRLVDRHLDVSHIHTHSNLGKRTLPYGANAYLDFNWVGAGMFLLVGFAQSYSITRLRNIEEVSHGIGRFITNYLIGSICVFSLYLFRSGLGISMSWGFAEMLVFGFFCVLCIIRIRPHVAV